MGAIFTHLAQYVLYLLYSLCLYVCDICFLIFHLYFRFIFIEQIKSIGQIWVSYIYNIHKFVPNYRNHLYS